MNMCTNQANTCVQCLEMSQKCHVIVSAILLKTVIKSYSQIMIFDEYVTFKEYYNFVEQTIVLNTKWETRERNSITVTECHDINA